MNLKFKKCLVVVSKNPCLQIIQYYKNFNFDLFLLTPAIPKWRIEGVNYILDSDVLKYSEIDFKLIDRPKWYYQQFLKIAVVMKLPYEYIHIIDGDSFLDEEAINSFDKLYYSKKNINICYCNFNSKFGLTSVQKNFIVNHMVFHKETLIKMFNDVFISWDHILININNGSWLSEYYTYANYVLTSGRIVALKKIKVFRRGDLLPKSCLSSLGTEYQLIAFEHQHTTSFLKKIYVKLLYFFKFNLG